jgi:ubiquinone/menaquinone biosynthesis C-methylase UbiE
MAMLNDSLDTAGWAAVSEVLALGCGTSVEVRALAQRADFAGRITAVDISPELITRGKTLADADGLARRVDWLVRDAQALALSDAAFDLVLAHTLVSHVLEPERVVREAARVVKPGGTVIVFDGDYATLTYGTDDPEYGRRMDEKIIAGLICNPRIMRVLPRLLRRVGLEVVGSRAWVLTEIGRADFFRASLESFRVLLPRAGVATPEEVEEFVADQLRASAQGTFFAGYNFYAVIAQRAR